MRRRLIIAALWLTGCTQVVEVDQYTFDVNPCGAPRTCEGGQELYFVITRSDIARPDGNGHLVGFNLDATDQTVCGVRDLVAPDGERGIDNQVSQLLLGYEYLNGVNIGDQNHQEILAGHGLEIVHIDHIDDLVHDDCVSVDERPAFLPAGVTVADLDQDGDGELDPGLTFDYSFPTQQDLSGCIIDGEVHARYPDSLGILPVQTASGDTGAQFMVQRARSRMPVDENGMHGALVGGSAHVDDLIALTSDDPSLTRVLDASADLDASSPDATDCSSLSFAFTFDAVPARLGNLHR